MRRGRSWQQLDMGQACQAGWGKRGGNFLLGETRVEWIGCTWVADLALSDTDQLPPLLTGMAFPNSLISVDTSKVASLSKDKTTPIFFLFLIQLREMSPAISD